MATVMLEIGLRVGAKKPTQKKEFQLLAVTLGEGAGTGVTLPCAPGSVGNSLLFRVPREL